MSMRKLLVPALIGAALLVGAWVGHLTHPAYSCPEDAVYTWNAGQFPAPRADYGCYPLDDLGSDDQ